MLLEIEIENLALFRSARAAFAPGLNALTGETGAGKTLVLKALALLRGQRADRAALRDGAAEARVSGLFRLQGDLAEEIAETIAPAELEDGDLLLTRTLGADGRGRCYANGRLIPLAALKAVGTRLIDVVGQGEARLLSEPEHRSRMVDAFGGLYEEHALYLAARERALARRRRRDQLVEEQMHRRQRLEFLRFVEGEIAAVDPRPGEAAELARELEVLEAAEELRTLCAEGVSSLYEADESVAVVLGRLAKRIAALNAGARDLLAGAAAALERAGAEVEEGAAQLRSALDRADSDPRRLASIEERLDQVRRLLDRFGPTEERLLATREEAAAEAARLASDEEDCTTADAELRAAEEELGECAKALDAKRAKAGEKLARAIERELKRLGMARARFESTLVPNAGETWIDRAQVAGASRLDFMLAANPGLEARPLEEVASGGEAARVALALAATLAEVVDVPSLVFDEIESGVGSRLGEVVAASLASVAAKRQVIVVSHVPAVAARAERHYKVEKRSDRGSTEATLVRLEGAARELEVAAMLRGEDKAQAARGAARELLGAEGKEAEA